MDHGAVSPTLTRWLRQIGAGLALGGCIYVAHRIWHLVYVSGAPLDWPEPGAALLALALCTTAMTALAFGWSALLRACDEPTPAAAAFRAFAMSQPVKYLPGNVLHLVTRHMLGRADGGTHRRLLLATVLETASLMGTALLLVGILASPEMFGQFAMARWLVIAIGAACLVGASITVAHKRSRQGLAWLAVHFASSALYFAATTMAFCLLAGSTAPAWRVALPVVSGSWVAGYLVVGAPGGLGVREAFLMQWLGQLTTANLLGTILGFRIVAIGADVLVAMLGWLLSPRGTATTAGDETSGEQPKPDGR